MRSRSVPLVAALCAVVGAAIVVAPVQLASAAAIPPVGSSGALVVVQRAASVPPHAVEVGMLPGSTRLSMRVVLEPRDPRALASFIDAVSTPSSPRYRHFLARGQFAARFGPTGAATAAVAGVLAHDGLRVASISQSHLVLSVVGRASGFAAALHAPIERWRLASGSTGYRLGGAARLPSRVAADVAGIVGISSLVEPQAVALRARPLDHAGRRAVAREGASAAGAVTAKDGPASGCASLYNSDIGDAYTPQQIGAAYGLDTAWGDGDDGTGHTIAVLELASYSMADIVAFDQCFGLISDAATTDPSVHDIDVDGGAGPLDLSSALEPTLDIDELRALAPGATVDVYLGPNGLPFGLVDTLQRIATDDTAQVVSISWGVCERFSDHAQETPIFEQMAAQGQSVFAASGDSGSSDCIDQAPTGGPAPTGPAVDDPASQPDVTGVGGLTVTSIAPLDETVWNDCGGASGGGISSAYARPSWQQAPGMPTGGAAGAHARLVPDLSVIGDPCDGTVVELGGTWTAVGGTSMGAPVMAATTAVAAQRCGASSLGLLNPRLYAMGRAGGYFNAVTTGTNETVPQTVAAHEYAAHAGYNMAAGLGSPNPSTFIDGLCSAAGTATATPSTPRSTATWAITLTTGSTEYVAGTTVTVTAPAGTTLPAAPSAWTVAPSAGEPAAPSAVATAIGAGSATANVATLTLPVGTEIAPFTEATVTATGVANPAIAGTGAVAVTDSTDAVVQAAPITFDGGGPDAAASKVTAPNRAVALGDAGATVDVTVRDAASDAVEGATVTASATGTASTIVRAARTTAAGTAKVTVRADAPGATTVTVDADGTVIGRATVRFVDPFGAHAISTSIRGVRLLGTPGIARVGATTDAMVARIPGGGLVAGTIRGAALADVRVTGTTTTLPVASSPSLVATGTRLYAAYRAANDDLVVLIHVRGAPMAMWRTDDLTQHGEAPAVTGDPRIVIAGDGPLARLSIASVGVDHDVLRTTAPLDAPTRFATLNISRASGSAQASIGDVTEARLDGSEALFATAAGGQLYMYTVDDGSWVSDNLATDAELYTGGGDAITGDPTAVASPFGVTVAVTTASHLLDVFVGSLGNWSASTLVLGSAGTSSPAGARSLPPVDGTPVIVMHGRAIDVYDQTVLGRLVMATSYGVDDPWACFDVTALAHVARGANEGVALAVTSTGSLIGVFGTRLEVVRGGAG